jgi:predicted transcriptional regulator
MVFKVNVSKRRTRFDIVIDILSVCVEGANKTKIVYNTNLNFRTANVYIDFLMESDLLMLNSHGDNKIYQTTDRGMDILRKFRDLEKSVKD